jgi:hypothetical protein
MHRNNVLGYCQQLLSMTTINIAVDRNIDSNVQSTGSVKRSYWAHSLVSLSLLWFNESVDMYEVKTMREVQV